MSETKYKLLKKYLPRPEGMFSMGGGDYGSSGRMREQFKPEVGDTVLVYPAENINFHIRVEKWESAYILGEIYQIDTDTESFDGWSIGSKIKIPEDAVRSVVSG